MTLSHVYVHSRIDEDKGSNEGRDRIKEAETESRIQRQNDGIKGRMRERETE